MENNTNFTGQIFNFLWENKRKILKGLVVLVSIDLLLLFFYLIPSEIQQNLVLIKEAPNIVSMFTNHYLHGNFSHLFGNILLFTFFSFLILLVSILIKNEGIFYKLLLFNLLVMPFLLSSTWLIIEPNAKSVMGFSGVVASFLGSFVFLYVRDFLKSVKIKVNPVYAFLYIIFFFMFNYTVIYFVYYLNPIYPLFTLPWIPFYILSLKNLHYNGSESIKKAKIFASFPLLFILMFSIFLFPFKVGNTAITTHAVGFFYGLLALYLPAVAQK